jgi:hypothetical protein
VPVSMHENAHSFIIEIASLYDCSIGFVNWSVNVIYFFFIISSVLLFLKMIGLV